MQLHYQTGWLTGWLAGRPKALGPSGCECKFCILLRSTHLVFDGWLYVVGWLAGWLVECSWYSSFISRWVDGVVKLLVLVVSDVLLGPVYCSVLSSDSVWTLVVLNLSRLSGFTLILM